MEGHDDIPHDIRLHQASRQLELDYGAGRRFRLSCEYLRVFSPSAEVRGHGPGQEVLQTGKRLVTIQRIEPVGHYALQFHFSDGHDTGIFTWTYLRQLCEEHDQRWPEYLQRLAATGGSRDPAGPVLIARQ